LTLRPTGALLVSVKVEPRYRPVSTLDVVASLAARVLPAALTPAIDQVRHDARMLLDGLKGQRELPFTSPGLGPRRLRPLVDIEPMAALLPRPLAERSTTLRRDPRGGEARGAGWLAPVAMPRSPELQEGARRAPLEAPEAGPQPVEICVGGVSHRVMAASGETVLEAGLAAGLPMPFSCAMGGCGACQVTLLEGEVRMEEPHCLTREERARGRVLACVSRPVSPVKVELP
jgi:ferredoxin